jgi:nucleoside-diphosphate-sugar epimerase
MRILVLGAGGFIGRHIVSELLAAGHDVIGVARTTQGLTAAFPQATFVALDLARAVHAHDWADRLAGVDAIVNAAGLLRGPDMDAIHVAMPKALIAAAERAGVARVVLISAISARKDVPTDYAISKLAGEAALRASRLDWTILRPSLVYGDGSYGGTSLVRGLAGLPFAVPLPGDGTFAFTPIHVRDLARSVRVACEGGLPPRQTLEPVGPETLTLRDLLSRYRAWLGFGRARFVGVPMPLIRLLARIGDTLGAGPIATNSLVQMIAGNAGDSEAFARAIGFAPQSMAAALRDRPAQVQDRWHARLFFLAPLLKVTLVLMWLVSAWLGLAHGEAQTEAVVRSLGLPDGSAEALRIGSSLLDIGVGAQLLLDRWAARSAVVQLAVVAGYTLVIGWALPGLWLDPLGPLIKNFPVMLAIAVYGVIGDKR